MTTGLEFSNLGPLGKNEGLSDLQFAKIILHLVWSYVRLG